MIMPAKISYDPTLFCGVDRDRHRAADPSR